MAFAEILRRVRRNDPFLTEIRLGGCGIDDGDAEALANALRRNSHVASLDLSMNYRMSAAGFYPLAEVLRTNAVITHLDLSGIHKFGAEGARTLSRALAVSESLTNVRLVWNNLGQEGACSLADALRTNKSIKSLSLRGTKIGPQGVKSIASVLQGNAAGIEALDLSENIVGAEGAQYIAEALCRNDVLKSLDLSACFIDLDGARSLAGALHSNNSVTFLDLRWNLVKTEGAELLVRSLGENETVTHLDLRHNEIISRIIADMAAASIFRNKSRTLRLFLKYSARFGQCRPVPGATLDCDELLSGLTGVFVEGSGKKWLWLLDSVSQCGMLQLQTDFSFLEVNVVPSALVLVKSHLGLNGAFEVVRARPDMFGHDRVPFHGVILSGGLTL